MGIGTILTMAGIGVGAAIAESVLGAFGKVEMAKFCNIAGLCGLGGSAIAGVITLFDALRSL